MSPGLRRRRVPNLDGRRISQTASQLTGGLESNSFFVPSTSTSNYQDVPATMSNQRLPMGTGQTTSSVPASEPLTETPSTSTNVSATPQKTPTPNSSAPVQQPATPTKSISNSTLANTTLSSAHDPLPSSTQQLAVAAVETSSSKPNSSDLSSRPLVNNTMPPNLVEAIGVAVAALALIIGGSLFYWFSSKKKKRRETASESVMNPMASMDHLSRSGSISSIKRPMNGPIDKKTIRLKKKTESIISFGPGPPPELNRY